MLSVMMLNVDMFSVIMLTAVMLNVVAPREDRSLGKNLAYQENVRIGRTGLLEITVRWLYVVGHSMKLRRMSLTL